MSLPLGEINVLILTDVHSWVGGHNEHEPQLNADYGSVLSFYEQLKDIMKNELDKDLFFVMNGDFRDGTGLSTSPPHALVPILERMPWDAVNMGNHELYDDESLRYITQTGGFVDWWNGAYLTSNIMLSATGEAVGSMYRILKGQYYDVLTFGFIYNMKDNSDLVMVQEVEDVVKMEWFETALRMDYDAILVLAHMDVVDPLVHVILKAIRSFVDENTPVQFVTGHTHYRKFAELDDYSTSFEPGRYLDTIGFVSFPSHETVMDTDNVSMLFNHKFIDANEKKMAEVLGVDKLATPNGIGLSKMIHHTEDTMGLNSLIGCSPHHYILFQGVKEKNSLWGLYLEEVIPFAFFKGNTSKVYIEDSGSLRYDLFDGNTTANDLIAVSPFRDTIYKVAEAVPGVTLLQLTKILNPENSTFYLKDYGLKDYGIAGDITPSNVYDLYTPAFSFEKILSVLANNGWNHTLPKKGLKTKLTTTDLWFEHAAHNWKCAAGGLQAIQGFESSKKGKASTSLLAFLVFALLGVIAFVIYRRRATARDPRPSVYEYSGNLKDFTIT
eukprot:CAMPEP_0118713418 /NCGR_PEP_ID=MMETSP0800-20121206/25501_1 /TAXON_ID=210618 ORGANISM="Striatella unipunctata, Strain CCMP2910" /NCGR_SAMPLE_ID=MMETSP0800 /ASSEMBLY_ACC=CAM_ASM_000638 /LENGTH=553 /DNA_ID=CAMNT_0006618859 /DNA_START=86 /DNA_END=1747 /DNA_ORIENTATION=+